MPRSDLWFGTTTKPVPALGGILVAILAGTLAGIMVTVAATVASGRQFPAPRGGGLVPGGGTSKTGLTREELVRSWDLDGDGTISKSEADLARARMRRQRLEMQLGSGLDPLTGLPRGDAPVDEADVDEPLFQLPPEDPAPPGRRPEGNALPGTRPPPLGAPGAFESHRSSVPEAGGAASGREESTTPPPERSGRASWLPPRPLAPGTTGGLRAGAPPAVPGYGSSAWSDLNAGRPRPPAVESGATPGSGRPATAGGGLLPSGRPPGRTGAIILPGQATGSVPPRQPVPPVPTLPQPRITAEEIGGYGP